MAGKKKGTRKIPRLRGSLDVDKGVGKKGATLGSYKLALSRELRKKGAAAGSYKLVLSREGFGVSPFRWAIQCKSFAEAFKRLKEVGGLLGEM